VRAPPLTPLAAAVLHVSVPERALVIGCGDGEGVLFLAREFPAARVRGVDPSPERVREAAARVGLDPEGRVAFKDAAPGNLPYPDQFFDLVVQLDGRLAPAEAVRVLRPAGHLALVRVEVPRFGVALREGFRRRRLAAHGIVPVASETAGDGNFFVGHLAKPD
jgi:ubiquinone/menaquinone biosynthesis C-methylase UbiE